MGSLADQLPIGGRMLTNWRGLVVLQESCATSPIVLHLCYMRNDATVHLRLPAGLLERIASESKRQGVSIGELIRSVLTDCFNSGVVPVQPTRARKPRQVATTTVSVTDDPLPPVTPTSRPTANHCARCGHPSHKHHGHGRSCQDDICRCPQYT